jgi:hypothetical protein
MSDPNYVAEFTDGSMMTADMATKDDDGYKIRLGKEVMSVSADKVATFHKVKDIEWEPTGVGELETEEGEVYELPFEKRGIAQDFLG